MRWPQIILGGLLSLMGVVWGLQGLNIVKGSFMTGDAFCGWTGLATLVIGLFVAYRGAFRGSRR